MASVALGQPRLLINEMLYQPRSGVAEYVELYNASDSAVDLADYHIVRWIGDSLGKHYALPVHTVAPRDYVVLTKDVASVVASYDVRYVGKLVECNLPPYPNGGGSVVLSTADGVVADRLDYVPSMHSPMLKDAAGVALERRSSERPTGEASNWFSASSTCGYGTPGYENSQSTEWLVAETAFEFSSAVVSPDGDDYQDQLEIEYRMDDASLAARAEVYDATGRRVARLLDGELLGSHGTLVWRPDAALPQGRYVVLLTLYDRSGTQQVIRRSVAIVRN